MKLRNDFVSNSSSCSFVIAINKEYNLKDFVKDLAEECTNPKSEYHNKDLAERNKRILDFCLNTYELAFLGAWKLRTDERVFSRKDIDDLFLSRLHKDDVSYGIEENEKEMLLKKAEEHWKYQLDCIEMAKKPDCDPYFKRLVDRNYIDQEGRLHTFNDVYAVNCIVDSDKMKYQFRRYGYEHDNEDQVVRHRVKQLKKAAEEYAEHEHGNLISYPCIGCYAITLNTIKNTRDLLNSGVKLEFSENLSIDDLEKRIKNGEQIFSIHIGHSGEGYGNYEIYCEDKAKGLDNISAEILDSEPM